MSATREQASMAAATMIEQFNGESRQAYIQHYQLIILKHFPVVNPPTEREKALEAALESFRDSVLHGRHQLEGVLDNYQTNAVLDLFDDTVPALTAPTPAAPCPPMDAMSDEELALSLKREVRPHFPDKQKAYMLETARRLRSEPASQLEQARPATASPDAREDHTADFLSGIAQAVSMLGEHIDKYLDEDPGEGRDFCPEGRSLRNIQAHLEGTCIDEKTGEYIEAAPAQGSTLMPAATEGDKANGVAEGLANAFLSWPLPESVCADLCATRQGPGRIGTNLLTFTEAKQMFTEIVLPFFDSVKDPDKLFTDDELAETKKLVTAIRCQKWTRDFKEACVEIARLIQSQPHRATGKT